MATVKGRNVEARREVILAAGKRWQERQTIREAGLLKIALEGPGAADTPKRRREYATREAAKAQLFLRAVQERFIGPTQDIMPFSPSLRASKAASPVARLVTLPDEEHVAEGFATGFLISDSLLLTNHHVFPSRIDCRGCGANFDHYSDERGVRAGSYFELDPDMFYFSDEELDFALVGVKSKGLNAEALTDFGKVRLIEATGKVQTGMSVNIIQHPGGGARQYATINNRLVDILDESSFLHYETDTDKGSSGSPVFNDDWELLALHHSGVPEMKNGMIFKTDQTPWDPENDSDESIHWIANEGTRVSSLVKRLRAATPSNAAEQMLLSKLLAATSDPVMTGEALRDSGIASSSNDLRASTSQNIFNISGNITIHVYGGSVLPPGLPVPEKQDQLEAAPAPALVLEKALLFDSDYTARKGYDPDFLGTRIDLPQVDPARLEELYLVSDYREYESMERNVPTLLLNEIQDSDPLVLPYHHYSLVVNKRYRMCMWTASNCDYTDDMRTDGRARKEYGGESWRLDRRVPEKYQLTDREIYKPAGNFDRGHIHRREDNCWGQRGFETEYANSDTYHWTNCTPQHELFNQENPKGEEYKGLKGVWGHFESQLQKQIEKGGGQAVLLAGPIIDKDTPKKDFGQGLVHYPLKFWKVVVVPESTARQTKLLAYGFIFDQSKAIEKFGLDMKELLALPHFDRERKSLREISRLSGISFPANVMEADQHRRME